MRAVAGFSLAAFAVLLAGCDSGSGTPPAKSPAPVPDLSATVQMPVDPGSPAVLTLSDGARVVIPAGAVKKATTARFSRLPDDPGPGGCEGLAGSVYDVILGAGDEQPQAPVEVTLPINAAVAASGIDVRKLALLRWIDGEWRAQAAAVDLQKRQVSGRLAHLSRVATGITNRFQAGPAQCFLSHATPDPKVPESPRRVPLGATFECLVPIPRGHPYSRATLVRVGPDALDIGDGRGGFIKGEGPVQERVLNGSTFLSFMVRVPQDARIGEECKVYLQTEDPQPVSLHPPLVICHPMVVMVDLDGLRQDVFRGLLTGPESACPNFRALAGKALGGPSGAPGTLKHRLDFEHGTALLETTTVFPSVTFAGHAAIFSGADLGTLKMAGNEWFDRKLPRRYGFTLDMEDTRPSYTGASAPVANERLKASGIKTVYQAAKEEFGVTSVVCHNMYFEGAEWKPYTWILDEGLYLKITLTHLSEYRMVEKALEVLGSHDPHLGILTLYFPGADHLGHESHDPASVFDRQGTYFLNHYDGYLGWFLDGMTDVLYKNTAFVFTADHGQTDMTVPRGAKGDRVGCFLEARSIPSLHKISDLLWELGYLPHGTYRSETPVPFPVSGVLPAPDSTAVIGLNGGMGHVYLRRIREGRSLNRHGDSLTKQAVREVDSFEAWSLPPLYRQVLEAAEWFRAQSNDPDVPEYAGCLDLILVRDAAQGGPGAPYHVHVGEKEPPVPLLEYLRRPEGRAWMTEKRMGWNGDDRDAAFLADRIARLQSHVSGDLILLPRYPDFILEYQPLYGDHGSLARTDMEIPFLVVRPGDAKPGEIVDVLSGPGVIDLTSKNRPANTDVKKVVLRLLQPRPTEPRARPPGADATPGITSQSTADLYTVKITAPGVLPREEILFVKGDEDFDEAMRNKTREIKARRDYQGKDVSVEFFKQ